MSQYIKYYDSVEKATSNQLFVAARRLGEGARRSGLTQRANRSILQVGQMAFDAVCQVLL
jgi:hypothetical protein